MEIRRKNKSKLLKLKESLGEWISKTPKYKNLIEKAKYYVKNPDELNQVITEAYNKATNETGNRTLSEMWGKMMTLFRLIKSSIKNEYTEVPRAKVLLGIAAILYFVSPVDILPDFLPIFGFVDDAALFAWFLKQASPEIAKFEAWENSRMQMAS